MRDRLTPPRSNPLLIADFSSDTYAYRFSLHKQGSDAILRVDHTRPSEGQRARVCDLVLSPSEAEALREALAIYLTSRGLPSEYKRFPARGGYPVLHPNGNVTFGEFTTTDRSLRFSCKALGTYRADPTDSFGLFVDEPRCPECDSAGDRVADLALDLDDATALRNALVEYLRQG